MDKRFLSILGGIIVIFIVIFAITQTGNKSNNSGNNSSGSQPTHNVMGLGQKGVTLVEWGDYECPVCGDYYQAVKQVDAQFHNQIYFQFRNLPLTAIHPNAFAAARAAQAAGLQNKYWQMHDKLYTNQDQWAGASNPQTNFDTYAQQIGLNVSQFNRDYASDQVNNSINADLAAFAKTGKEMATPTFFLDGKYVNNSELVDPQTGQPSVTQFANLLNAEIAAKTKS